MGASMADAGGGRSGWHRAMMMAGHYGIALGPIAGVVIVAVAVAGKLLGMAVVALVVVAVIAVALLVAIALRFAHDRYLCERCPQQQPWFDPQAAIDKNRRRLWFFHKLLFAPPVLLIFAVVLWRFRAMNGLVVFGVAAVLVVAGSFYASLSLAAHVRLRFWCPSCRPGRGGGYARDLPPETTPDPGVPLGHRG